MIRTLNILWMGALAVAGVLAFRVSAEAEHLEIDQRQIARQIQDEREAIALLQAEWAHLNDPLRLETLARRHTDLMPMGAHQFARLRDLPPVPPLPTPGEGDPGAPPLLAGRKPLPAAPEGPAARIRREPPAAFLGSSVVQAAAPAGRGRAKPDRAASKPSARPATPQAAQTVTPSDSARYAAQARRNRTP